MIPAGDFRLFDHEKKARIRGQMLFGCGLGKSKDYFREIRLSP